MLFAISKALGLVTGNDNIFNYLKRKTFNYKDQTISKPTISSSFCFRSGRDRSAKSSFPFSLAAITTLSSRL